MAVADPKAHSISPQPGPQWAFLSTPADIAIYGGAAGGGKTYALILEAARGSSYKNFSGVIFRRTYPQVTNAGGLWDKTSEVYPIIGGAPYRARMDWEFAGDSRVSLRHMQYEDTKYDYQGSEYTLIGWDELTHFGESTFFYMMSRNRSSCSLRPYVRGTCNPDSESWVRRFISWWIAEDGYADMSRAGVLRWFIRDDDNLVWGDSKSELEARFNGTRAAKSVTFIPASVYDNRILMKNDPSYVSSLMALASTERQRLLGDKDRGGNWNIRAGGTVFKRDWFKKVRSAPADMKMCRFWDLASTQVKGNSDPDWTAGVLMGTKDGRAYILDVRRDRKSPSGVEDLIRHTAEQDGRDVTIRMEEEGGSAGKVVIDHYARRVLQGYVFRGVRATGSKEYRAMPMASAAEKGNVLLVHGDWNDAFVNEADSFSPECAHDDQVDAAAGAFNTLVSRNISPHFGDTAGDAAPAAASAVEETEHDMADERMWSQ